MIAANSGLQTDIVFAAIFYLSAVAILLFLFVNLVERLAIPWHAMQVKAAHEGGKFD